MKKRIFSGIQPSGTLHLGNYLGALQNWVMLQDQFDPIFSIVDLHSITVPQKPSKLKESINDTARMFLAAGIDPQNSKIFIQSRIKEHAELGWILGTITKIPELERMTQFKDKSLARHDSINAGLFTYPILMAADILIYDAEVVPVGEDQVQHVELARTLARRFNQIFGETFVVPEAKLVREGMRIMGLDDPSKKMSKSATSEYNYISLLDPPEVVADKIKKAVTDSDKEIRYRDEKPAIKNLINIFSLLDNIKPEEVEEVYRKKSYAEFKADLVEVINAFLGEFQEKYRSVDQKAIEEVLEQGENFVRPRAEKKMAIVKEKIGLI